MITGAHTVIYSRDPDADRAFFRDVLKLNHVDSGDGWLVFSVPAAELAVHPSDTNDVHEFYLICDHIQDFVAELKTKKVPCSPIQEERWGSLVKMTLPGGGRLGVYQPKHLRP